MKLLSKCIPCVSFTTQKRKNKRHDGRLLEAKNKVLREKLAQQDKEHRKKLATKDEHIKYLTQEINDLKKEKVYQMHLLQGTPDKNKLTEGSPNGSSKKNKNDQEDKVLRQQAKIFANLTQPDERENVIYGFLMQIQTSHGEIAKLQERVKTINGGLSMLRGRAAIEEFEDEFSEDALKAEAKALEEERKTRQLDKKTGKKKSTRKQKQDENQEQQNEYLVGKYERIRRSRERTWLRIFKYLSHVLRVAELKNTILKRTTSPYTVEEFAREISKAYSELSKKIHKFIFDWFTNNCIFTENLALTKQSSTVVEIVMSMFNFKAPE